MGGRRRWVSTHFICRRLTNFDSNLLLLAGIGSLIIDLDADIEKSSSTNLESNSLVIPLGSTEDINAPRNSSKNKEKISNPDSAEKGEFSSTWKAVSGHHFEAFNDFHENYLISGKRKEGSNMSTTTNSGNKSSKISMDHQVCRFSSHWLN